MLPDVRDALPNDHPSATLVGRVHDPAEAGPVVVAVRGDRLVDLGEAAPTLSALTEHPDPVGLAREAAPRREWPLADVLAATLRGGEAPRLLAPADLHVLKAAGVTFAGSMLERVIEERAGGDAGAAAEVRTRIERAIGDTITSVRPGSPQARTVKQWLQQEGLWSQYLEVGLGPDPEIFTKAPLLAAVGTGERVGVPRDSRWNNPEPEVVLAVRSDGRVLGATLGNDVNLRDVEGRSALLLPKAKDNNASAALGPLIRLFDEDFDLDRVRRTDLHLRVTGADGFVLDGRSSMREISRDPAELVSAALGTHQYPDGFLLYTGTAFAPTEDRDVPGHGFTHHSGDRVRITSSELGALVNEVAPCDECPQWTFGLGALLRNLGGRGLLGAPG
ncbi:fumarylacetoacetate hydrolase family protein [Salinifilum ghardaiensis]